MTIASALGGMHHSARHRPGCRTSGGRSRARRGAAPVGSAPGALPPTALRALSYTARGRPAAVVAAQAVQRHGGTGGFHVHWWARLLRFRHLPGPVSTGEARMRSAPRRVSTFVGVLAAVALLATACSSDKTTKSSTASNEPVTLQVNLFGTFGYKEAGLFD